MSYMIWGANRTDILSVGESPYPGFRGCFVTEASSIARGDFIASAILELGLCLSIPCNLEAHDRLVVLALMSISAYKTSLFPVVDRACSVSDTFFTGKSGSQSELLQALHRDG